MAQAKKDTNTKKVQKESNTSKKTKQEKKGTTSASKKAKDAVKNKAKATATSVKKTAKTVTTTAKDLDREKVKDILLKEEMTREHKVTILTLSSILIAFFIYIGVSVTLQNLATVESTLEVIELSTYEKLSKGADKEVVYVATKNSEVNKEYEDILVEVVRNRKTKVKFLDLGLVKERNQLIGFMNTLELTKDSYTEPMLIIFEDGNVKASLLGASTKKELITFLDKNRID